MLFKVRIIQIQDTVSQPRCHNEIIPSYAQEHLIIFLLSFALVSINLRAHHLTDTVTLWKKLKYRLVNCGELSKSL